jgi:hypothetical protein
MQDLSDLFKGSPAAVLLFLTESENVGHWICVLDKPDHVEVFDSFGTAIDGDRKWLDKKELLEFGQCAPLLSDLIKKSNKPAIHNTTKLQNDDSDTCGRWVCLRILESQLPLQAFVSKVKKSGMTPDDYVTKAIYDIIGK